MNEQQDFLHKVRTALDDEALQPDAETRQRLVQARRQALDTMPGSASGAASVLQQWWRPASLVAMAAALVLSVVIWQGQLRSDVELLQSGDMEMFAATESLNLYEDLEFYQWLEENADNAG